MNTVQNEIISEDAPTPETDTSEESSSETMADVTHVGDEEKTAVATETSESDETDAPPFDAGEDGGVDAGSDGVQRYMFEQLREINERLPEVRSLDDIVRLGRYGEIKEKVVAGYTLSDAVRLVYEDEYIKTRVARARAEARRELVADSHLFPTSPTGVGIVDISDERIRQYMDAIPGSSREDAICAYKKYRIKK